jgi:hypothetical protein
VSAFLEKRAAAAAAAQRRAEDMAIACGLICRYVGPVDALVAALDAAGGSTRLVKALRGELARRRGGRR